LSSTDALFTRFEGLFKKHLDSKQFLFLTLEQLGIEQASLRVLFYYSWDNGDLPSKQMLLEVLQITYPSGTSNFWGSPTALEDHVLESFALALEELKFAEHTDSLPQHPQQKSKPGRKANPKVGLRREVVRKHIHGTQDFDDESKLKLLLQELDEKEIPPPEDIDKLSSFTCSWEELLKKPGKLARVVKVLNRDRWPKKSDLIRT